MLGTTRRLSLTFGALIVACALAYPASSLAQSTSPNVVFIVVDDLNDWVGALGGHPQARTPRIDTLAAQGVLFTNAHAAATLCHPSRVSFMTGISPDRAGIRDNKKQPWRNHLPRAVSLNQAFRNAGYYTVGYGKVYHGNEANHDPANWDERRARPSSALPPKDKIPLNGLDQITRGGPGGGDWGVLDRPVGQFEDHKVATWAVDFLRTRNAGNPRPFFLAVGLRSPHSPWYFPTGYYNRIAGGVTQNIVLPQTLDNDLGDVGAVARRWAAKDVWAPLVTKRAKVKSGVHGYLAAGAFVDDQVGRILDALENSAFASTTIVVLLSDHGYHLSEKQTWQKHNLWEEDTRVPLIFRIPGRFASTMVGKVEEPTSISAVFPTLLELAGIPEPKYRDGDPQYRVDYRSLVPLIENKAQGSWDGPAVAYGKDNSVSIRTAGHRYTYYPTSQFKELYEILVDSEEWYNVAGRAGNQGLVNVLTSDALRYLNGEHAPFGFRETCGPPGLNAAKDFGIHLWRTCGGEASDTWRLRVTGGGNATKKVFKGSLVSSRGFGSVVPVGIEKNDSLTNGIKFQFSVAGADMDGVNFAFPANASVCLNVPSAPAGADVFIGAARFPVTFPVNLATLAKCGSTQTASGAIGDFIWQDKDDDGIQDRGEPGAANAEVRLLDCDNRTLSTTTTDSNGKFRFGQLAAGRYKLRFVLPSGYTFSPRQVAGATGGTDSDANPTSGLTTCMSIADGQSRLGIDAGLVVTGGGGTRITSWKGATGGVSVSGNTVRYSGTPTGWVNTVNSAPLSSLGAGSRFTVGWTVQAAPANATWVVGLGIAETSGKDWRDVDFGFHFDGEKLTVRENGGWIATAKRKLAASDRLQIRVTGTTLKYFVNGTEVARSGVSGIKKLYVDTAFKRGAVTMSNFTLSQ